MAILDPGGRILDWNRAAERILSFSRDEALGQSALLVRRPEDARKLELLLRRTVREKRLADFETQITRRDGSDVPVAMNVCPLEDDRGHVTAVGVVMRDQSRQKALERRLAEHDKIVTIGRLAGGMSHHINNILAAVSAKVEMALASRDAEAARAALKLTAESVDRLTNITRNLLLASGAEHRRPNTCRPAPVVRQVLARLRDELAGPGVTLDDHVHDTPPVRLDARDVHQVLENLVLNARQALPDAGTITVGLAAAGRHVVLTVADDGPGVPSDDVRHVFDPFWTTRGSLAGGSGGALGLGLTVARSLANAAGGSVELVSAAPGGTTVTVRLPAAPDADAPRPKSPTR